MNPVNAQQYAKQPALTWDDAVAFFNSVISFFNTAVAYLKLALAWVIEQSAVAIAFLKAHFGTLEPKAIGILVVAALVLWALTRWRARRRYRRINRAQKELISVLQAENGMLKAKAPPAVDFAPVLQAITASKPAPNAELAESLRTLLAGVNDISASIQTNAKDIKPTLESVANLRNDVARFHATINSVAEKMKPVRADLPLDELLMQMSRQFALEIKDPVKAAREAGSLFRWLEARQADLRGWGYDGLPTYLDHPENRGLANLNVGDQLKSYRVYREKQLAAASNNVAQLKAS